MATEQHTHGVRAPSRIRGIFDYAARQLQEFCSLKGDATYIWPRWILLRGLGALYLVIFWGVVAESQALIGPKGIAPLPTFFEAVEKVSTGPVEMLLRAPTLFWFGTGSGMIAALGWCGVAAAALLLFNVWPRMALFGCWLIHLSFVASWQAFSSTIVDEVMIETALLSIAFAPAGVWPGLGGQSPPRRIAVFTMRWLLFRMMFESGIMKILLGDPHWRNFTATELMYDTSPFPTVVGYYMRMLPHYAHVGEVAFTYVAELVAPLLAVFGGRWGRWAAFGIWVAFQAGIQASASFGWLNTGAAALGIVLLDDQMLASAANALRLGSLRRVFAGAWAHAPRPAAPLARYGLRVLLGAHFLVTLYYSVIVLGGFKLKDIPYFESRPVEYLVAGFRSVNVYYPYAYFFATSKYEVEFMGSNDGGSTWRTYEYKYKPQQPDRICGFIAPRYARFEATLQIAVFNVPKSRLFPKVAAQLIECNPDVVGLFKANPFPDKPPTMIRMPVYELQFEDLGAHRRTGLFWKKKFAGDYLPMVYVNDEGRIVEAKK